MQKCSVKIIVSWSINNWRVSMTYFAALHELHNQKEVLVVLINVEKLDDVRVVNLLENVDLILQANLILFSQLAPTVEF